MSNFVRMFQPRFAEDVRCCLKRQTVRKTPKRMPKAGDRISCRAWMGKPYRSKQRVLIDTTLLGVGEVCIDEGLLVVDGMEMNAVVREVFAHDDGFECWDDLAAWFKDTHELPFKGIVMFW